MTRLRDLLHDSLVYGLGRYITSAISVFFVPIYARVLGTEGYGLIDSISVWSGLVITVSIFGLDSAVGYFYFTCKEDVQRRELLFAGMLFRLASAIALSAAAYPLILWFVHSATEIDCTWIVMLSLVKNPFLSLGNYCRDVLRLEKRAWLFFWSAIIYSLLAIGLTILFVITWKRGVAGVFEAAALTEIVCLPPLVLLIRKRLKLCLDLRQFVELAKYGGAILPTTLILTAIATVDRLVILWMLGVSAAGIYGMAARIVGMLGLALSGYQMAWGIWGLSIKNNPDAKQIYAKVLSCYAVVFGFAGLVLTLFGIEVLVVLTTPKFYGAAQVIGYLVMAQVVAGMMNQVGIGSAVANVPINLSISAFVGGIVTLIAYVPCVSIFGLTGAACATLTGYVVTCTVLTALSHRCYPIQYRYALVVLPMVMLGVTAGFVDYFPMGVSAGAISIKLGILAAFVLALGPSLYREIKAPRVLAETASPAGVH